MRLAPTCTLRHSSRKTNGITEAGEEERPCHRTWTSTGKRPCGHQCPKEPRHHQLWETDGDEVGPARGTARSRHR
jgi:hypothetical protein